MRIIGGVWKRSRLPVADLPGLRPTPDRVRETLFNWLGQDLSGWKCVDAFAGTGALGFEAASRGAAGAVLVELDPGLARALRASGERLAARNVTVVCGDGIAYLDRAPRGSLDLVFLDPPFASDLFGPALRSAAGAVAGAGHVYLEAPRRWNDAALEAAGFALHRYLRAGAVHAHLLRRRAGEGSLEAGADPA